MSPAYAHDVITICVCVVAVGSVVLAWCVALLWRMRPTPVEVEFDEDDDALFGDHDTGRTDVRVYPVHDSTVTLRGYGIVIPLRRPRPKTIPRVEDTSDVDTDGGDGPIEAGEV